MSECCNGTCRRAKPIHIRRSGLTERFYAVTRYKEHDSGVMEAQEKHDVTEDVRALIADAEARGAAAERTRLTASVQGVCDAYQRWDGKAASAGECSAALRNLRAALATPEEQP